MFYLGRRDPTTGKPAGPVEEVVRNLTTRGPFRLPESVTKQGSGLLSAVKKAVSPVSSPAPITTNLPSSTTSSSNFIQGVISTTTESTTTTIGSFEGFVGEIDHDVTSTSSSFEPDLATELPSGEPMIERLIEDFAAEFVHNITIDSQIEPSKVVNEQSPVLLSSFESVIPIVKEPTSLKPIDIFHEEVIYDLITESLPEPSRILTELSPDIVSDLDISISKKFEEVATEMSDNLTSTIPADLPKPTPEQSSGLLSGLKDLVDDVMIDHNITENERYRGFIADVVNNPTTTIPTELPEVTTEMNDSFFIVKEAIFDTTDSANQFSGADPSNSTSMEWIRGARDSMADSMSSVRTTVTSVDIGTPEEVVKAASEALQDASAGVTWEQVVAGVALTLVFGYGFHRLVKYIYCKAYGKIVAERNQGILMNFSFDFY